jgi:hypothetical protein
MNTTATRDEPTRAPGAVHEGSDAAGVTAGLHPLAHHLLRRLWLIVLLAALAGVTAWMTLQGQEDVYQARLEYVLRPAASLDPAEVPDAVRNLSSNSGQFKTTLASVLSSDRFLHLASQRALGSNAPSGYSIVPSNDGESDILVLSVEGPDRDTVEALSGALTGVAGDWVRDVYRLYQLDLLTSDIPGDPLPQDSSRVIILAVALGALLGLGVAYTEWRARAVREGGSTEAAVDASGLDSLNDRLDRLEGSLSRLESSLGSRDQQTSAEPVDSDVVVPVRTQRLGVAGSRSDQQSEGAS